MNQDLTVLDAVQLHGKKKAALVPRANSLNIIQHYGLFPSFRALFSSSARKFRCKDWIFLIRTQVPPVTTRNDFSRITSLLTAMPGGAQPRSPTAEQDL